MCHSSCHSQSKNNRIGRGSDLGLGLLHELKKLASGIVVAEAAKLAAAIFLYKIPNGVWFIPLSYLIN